MILFTGEFAEQPLARASLARLCEAVRGCRGCVRLREAAPTASAVSSLRNSCGGLDYRLCEAVRGCARLYRRRRSAAAIANLQWLREVARDCAKFCEAVRGGARRCEVWCRILCLSPSRLCPPGGVGGGLLFGLVVGGPGIQMPACFCESEYQ